MGSSYFGVVLKIAAILLLLSCQIIAQSRTNSSGTGGMHVIQGRVFLPTGGTPGSSIPIRLESSTFATISVYTDGNGAFRFSSLAPGNYTVVVDAGEHYEIVREYVTIDPGTTGALRVTSAPMVITVPMYLLPKRGEQLRNEILNAKLANVPKDALDPYEKGLELLQKEKVDEAIVQFRQALMAYPSFTACHIQLGKVYLVKGMQDDAAASFRNAIRLDPQNFEAHISLGIALLQRQKFEEAEPELVTAAYLDKTAVTPHYYIGLLYVEKRNYDIAQKAFETARDLPGGDALPLLHRYLGGIYYSKKMNKQAIGELEKYLQLAPKAKDAEKIHEMIAELKSKH